LELEKRLQYGVLPWTTLADSLTQTDTSPAVSCMMTRTNPTENHGVDSSILSLATSLFFLHSARFCAA
jgi:hypothetical protein